MSGVESLAFELAEQHDAPIEHVFCPAGGGGLTQATAQGFAKLAARGRLDCSPAVHCVQPEGNNTIAGPLRATFPGEEVCINMSEPFDLRENIALDLEGEALTVHFINTGVPHVVLPVGDVEIVDITTVGRALRYHDEFAPSGTNANIFSVIEPGHIRVRTYERGVEGETLACGTGVVANAIVHHLLTGVQAPISVDVQGGDILKVNFRRADNGVFQEVKLIGPADFVFTGEISI